MIKRTSLIAVLVLIVFSVVAAIRYDNSEPMLLITLFLTFLNIIIGFNDVKNRYTYILFNICFFTFLLGRVFFSYVSDENVLSGFSRDTIHVMYVCMSISLICLTIGMYISEKVKISTGKLEKYKGILKDTGDVSDLKTPMCHISSLQVQVITIAFYCSYPFYLLSIVEKALYVGNTSYLDYYTTYVSSIPYILVKVGELNLILTALLFCVQYEFRKLIVPTILFSATSVISLGIGQRNIFVLNIIMLACCLVYANHRSIRITGKRLYSRRVIPLIIILVPVLISFLYAWGNYRQNASEGLNFSGGIKEFFVSQGGQIEFFANTIEHKTQIWAQQVPYTFSAIFNYFRNLFGLNNYGTYTRENALYGNSLGATQFYITSPGSLLSGKGAGCCYLSELFFDAGIIGIVIGSVFLGVILRKLILDEEKKPWVNAFIILMIRWIVYIPRASYFDWISNPFNIWNVAIIVIVFNVVRLIRSKQ